MAGKLRLRRWSTGSLLSDEIAVPLMAIQIVIREIAVRMQVLESKHTATTGAGAALIYATLQRFFQSEANR